MILSYVSVVVNLHEKSGLVSILHLHGKGIWVGLDIASIEVSTTCIDGPIPLKGLAHRTVVEGSSGRQLLRVGTEG